MKKYLFVILSTTLIISCTKYTVQEPGDFDVITDKTEYAVGDTVNFIFTGNPDYIIFYSGEPGKDYAYADTRNVAPDSVLLTFSTNTTAASSTTQPLSVNRVSLLVSTNFSGTMDSSNIKNATWRDISDVAKWATTTTTLSSGVLSVNQYRSGDKPVYFAFRYTSDTVKANYLARKWTIASFSLRSYFNGVFNSLAGGNTGNAVPFTTGGFLNKSILDGTNNWAFGNTSLTFNAPAVGALPNEDWTISRAFDFTQYVPDPGIGIKTPSVLVTDFQYRVMTAGTYTVTFLAKNQSAGKIKQVTRQITLQVK